MYLTRWKAVVESKSDQLIGLTLEASVECPNSNCRREVTIQSDDEVLLPIEHTLSRMIRQKVNKLIARRACTYCGTVSEMPRRSSGHFLAKVMTDITSSWIEGQIISTPVASEQPDPVEEPDGDEEEDEDEENEDEEKGEPVPLGA